MAKRTGAAIDVHDIMGEVHLMHERQRHHGEGFVDLPQIDILFLPANPLQQFLRRRDRCRGEQPGRLGVAGVADDAGAALCTVYVDGS